MDTTRSATDRGKPVSQLAEPLQLGEGATLERYRWMVESVSDVIFEAAPDGTWTYLNPAWTRILGHDVAECLGKGFHEYVHPDCRQDNLVAFADTLSTGKPECRMEVRYRTADGGSRYMEIRAGIFRRNEGTPLGSTGTITETIAHRLAELELELEHRATHGPLTRLPNCAQLCERIETCLRGGTQAPLTLDFLDVNRLKLVNDSLGHDVGDTVLRLAPTGCGFRGPG